MISGYGHSSCHFTSGSSSAAGQWHQGTESEIAHALFIISEAVDRYKALCEGAYAGAQRRGLAA